MKIFTPRKTSKAAWHTDLYASLHYKLLSVVFLLSCLLIGADIKAQVANYTFGASAGTYAAITGTIWQSGATVSTNAISAAIPIGFSFRYNNANYTQLYISNNGFIFFGNTPVDIANYTPISQSSNSGTYTNGYDGAISGFGANLVASAASGAAPSIIYGASGSDFVVQFTDLARSGVTADRITFQIRLTQTTNVIQLVYNAATAASSTTYPQVGLRGASFYDWKNLSGTTATTWTAPTSTNTAGTASSTLTMRFNSAAPAAAPVAGQTYTWTPPAQLGAATYATLPATENFDAAPWVNGNALQDLPSAASWRTWPSYGDRSWRRHDVTIANSGWVGVGSGNGLPTVATPASGGVARWHKYDANKWSRGYMDFFVNFSPTGTKTLTFSLLNAGPDSLMVALSTDGGATFAAPTVYYTAITAWANQSLVLGSSTSATCVVRFTAASQWGSAADVSIDNVSITNASCGAITSSAATAITSSGATANWSGGAGSYIIEYGATGFTPGTGATAGTGGTVITALAGATSAAISSLSANTTYQYYVRQVCSGPTYSANSSVQAFTTLCASVSVFPFTENFNSVTTPALPGCWSQNDANADGDAWITYTTYGVGGTLCAGLFTDGNVGANNDYLILPRMTLTGSQKLGFSVRARSTSEPNDYEVVLSTTGNAPANFTTIIKPLTTVSTTTQTAITPISLAPYTGDVYLAIHVPAGGLDGYYLYVDDVSVTTVSCIDPAVSAATAISATGATVNWAGGTGSYIIEYGAAGFTPGTGAAAGVGGTVVTALAGATSKVLAGLTGNTTYNVYVRQVCAGPTYGGNSTVIAFTTPCTNVSLNVVQGFNATTIPSCWSQQYVVGTSNITYVASNTNPATVPQEGTQYVYWNSFNIANLQETRLVSPPITTTGTSSLDLSFYWKNDNNTSYNAGVYLLEGVQVQYSTDGTTWTDVPSGFFARHDGSLTAGTSQWKQKSLTLPAAVGNQATIYIGFKFHSSNGDNIAFDNLNIFPTPSCTAITSAAATAITGTGATANWTGGTGSYIIEYGATGFTPGTGATAGTGGTVVTALAGATSQALTSLTASTTYQYYVRQVCAGPTYGANSAVQTFSTSCASLTLNVVQGFNATTRPACWTEQNVIGTNPLTYVASSLYPTTAPQEGTQYVLFNSFQTAYTGTETRLVSPPITTTGTSSVDLSFYWNNGNATAYSAGAYLNEGVQVQYSADGITWTNVPGAFFSRHDGSLAAGAYQWKQKALTLPAAVGNQATVYIGFKFHSEAGEYSAFDNLNIYPTPACPGVTSASATAITATGATANWSGGTGSYIIEYGVSGFTPGTGATAGTGGTVITASAGATSAAISSLSANTTYQYYVRQVCSGPAYGLNSGAQVFTTACNAVVPPYTQNFESVTTPAIPTCTSVEIVSGYDWYTASPAAYGFTSKTLVYEYDATLAANTWYYIQGLSLTAGNTYRLTYRYGNTGGTTYPENLEVKYGTSAINTSMTNTLATQVITNSTAATYTVDFTPTSTDVYYIGFHAYSPANRAYLLVDDINVIALPNCTGTPTAGTATVSTTGTVCTGSPLTLTLAGYTTGVAGISIKWQSKPAASGSFTDIPGATSATYTESPVASTQYRAVVTCSYSTLSANSNTITQLVSNPTITGTGGPTSICGPGTVNLTATTGATTDTAYWYADNTTSTSIGKGPTFTTPTISATTTYYVGAQSGSVPLHVGMANAATSSGTATTQWGITFSATAAATIQSVAVYPVGTGSLTISVQSCANGCSTPTIYGTYTANFTAATGTKQILPINISVPVGTGMKMVVQSSTGLTGLYRELAGSFPYTTVGSPISLTSSEWGGNTTAYYYYFYDWVIGTGCVGPRTPVTVTYTTPPTLSAAPPTASICNGDSVTIVSNGPAYSTITWSPAGTLSAATGVSVVAKPTNTTDYVITGTGASGGCTNSVVVRIDVKATPINPTVTPGAATLCSGQSIKLRASGSALSQLDTLTSQNFNSGLAGWTVTDASFTPTTTGWKLITNPYNYYGYSGPQYVNYGVTTPFSPFFITNSDTGGASVHTTTALTSITFPTTGYASLKLYYRTSYMYFAGDTNWVQISTNGTTWTTVKSYTAATAGTTITSHPPIQDSVDISAYIGNANVQVRFFHGSGYGYSWSLDNVFITGLNTTPQYTWTPATGLYTNTGLTTSYVGGAFADSVYAAPTATTLYTTLVTNTSTGCAARDTTTVTVNNPATAVANASGNASITNDVTYTLAGSATNYTSYTWSATGAGSLTGTGTLTPTYDPAVGQLGTVTVTLTVNAAAPCASPVVSTMVLTITPGSNNVWIGNTSDWFTASNWTSGVVPNSCAAVAIVPAVNSPFVYPVISGTSPQVGNFSLAAGAQITLNAAKTLSICGSWTGGTTANANILGAGSVVFNGTTNQTITGRNSFGILNINKTAGTTTLNGREEVRTALVLTRGNATNSGVVTLKSDATGTAYLDNFTSGTAGTYIGNLTVERYISNTAQGYRNLSPPVAARVGDWAADFTVNGLDGVNCWYQYNPYPTLQYYNESTNSVSPDFYGGFISTTDVANQLTAGKGYAARIYTAPLTINTTGTPNNGAISAPITKTTSSVVAADGWNLVGNPYPSPISWNSFNTLNSGKTNGSVYRFTTTGEYTGNYATWNGTTGTLGATNEIASTQGFWVVAPANSTLNFDNTIRTASNTAPSFKTTTALADEIRLTLTSGTQIDEVVSYTDAAATVGEDAGYDAAKMAAGSTIYLSFDMPAREFAINVMTAITEQSALPLRVAVTDTGSYTFTATALNLTDATLIAYLKDAEMNTLTDLSAGPITLTLSGSHFYTGRFSVVFKKKDVAPTGIVKTETPAINIYSYDGNVYVVRSSASAAVINISNLLGQDIATVSTAQEKTVIPMQVTEPWYALVKVTEGGTVNVRKVLISNK